MPTEILSKQKMALLLANKEHRKKLIRREVCGNVVQQINLSDNSDYYGPFFNTVAA